MRVLISVFVVLVTVLALLPLTASASEEGPVDKLGRGLSNILTSPFELSAGMGRENSENGPFAGLTTGTLKGIAGVVKRAAVGVYEVATFPLPVGGGYDPVITDPEYVLQKDNGKNDRGLLEK